MVVPEVKIEYDRNNIKIVKSAVGTSPKTTGQASKIFWEDHVKEESQEEFNAMGRYVGMYEASLRRH